MHLQQTAALTAEQKEQLWQLWNTEYPAQLAHPDPAAFAAYLATLEATRHRLLLSQQGQLLGWGVTFRRQQALWFVLIVSTAMQGQGHGSRLLHALQTESPELNGWVVDETHYSKADGQPYASPLGFYRKNGFVVLPDVRLDTPILSAVQVQWRAAKN
jgi:GNAT superfamily N-acetyltransferase